MVQVRYHPNFKMFIYILAIYDYLNWIVFIICVLSILSLYFYLKLLGALKPILYKSYYLLSFAILAFILIYYYIDILILDLLGGFTDDIYIRDPYDFVNLEIDLFGFNLIFYLWLYLIFLIITYGLNFSSKWGQNMVIFIVIVCFFYSFFWKGISEKDLLLSNWESFTNDFKFQYKIQLDVALLTRVFFEELLSLFNFLSSMVIWMILQIYLIKFWWFRYLMAVRKYNHIRLISLAAIFIFLYTFLGGETLIRDLFLLSLVFLTGEVLFLALLFFRKLKRYFK